jgi:putative transposase
VEETWLCNEILELYQTHPYYGYRRITAALERKGLEVNHKRVVRLMRELNLQAIYPKPNTSKPASGHKIYPYLLEGLVVTRPNQVWATDITYIKLAQGFAYLVALIDLYSRYITAWRLSNTLETSFCIEALKEALALGVPLILNTDQGAQFTSNSWIEVVEGAGIKVSMDGKGRYQDNIYVERLWRTIKYEHIFLYAYESLGALRSGLKQFIATYNKERLHQSLGYRTPLEVYERKEHMH